MAANPFDQFDAAPAAVKNPFDQFDATPSTRFSSSGIPLGRGEVERQNMVAEPKRTLGGFAANVAKSGGEFAKGIVSAAIHPVDTIKTMGELATGAALHAAPKEVVDWFNKHGDPEKVTRIMDMAKAVGGQYAKDYGSLEGIQNKLYTDPVGVAADVSTLFSLGASAAGKMGAVKTAAGLTKAAEVTNPLTVLKAPVPFTDLSVGEIPSKIVSKTAGRVVNTLSDIANPKAAALLAATEGRAPEVINALVNPSRPTTPGYKPTAAEAAANLDVTKLSALQADVAKQAPSAYYQRGLAQDQALLKPLQVSESLPTAKALRGAVTEPMYKKATSAGNVADISAASNLVDDLINRNPGNEKLVSDLNSVKRGMLDEAGNLRTNAEQVSSIMDNIKVLLADQKDPFITKQLTKVKESIESGIPNYTAAQKKYAQMSEPINQMEIADFLKEKLTSPLRGGEKLTPAQFASAVENAPATIKQATGYKKGQNLSDILTPDQVKVLDQIKSDLANRAKFEEQARVGGKGEKAMLAGEIPAAPHVFSRVVSLTNDIISRLQGRITRKMALELATDMLDPKATAMSISKAYSRKNKMENLANMYRNAGGDIAEIIKSKPVIAAGQIENALARGQQEQNKNALARD